MDTKLNGSIILVGHQLAWKSSAWRNVAVHSWLEYGDVDEEIVSRRLNGESIRDFSMRIWEDWQDIFRPFESEILKILLQEKTVISLWGGTPFFQNNRDIIDASAQQKSTVRILLDISLDEQMNRWEYDVKWNANRWDLWDQAWVNASMDEKRTQKRLSLAAIKEKRHPIYRDFADVVINVDGNSKSDTLTQIITIPQVQDILRLTT